MNYILSILLCLFLLTPVKADDHWSATPNDVRLWYQNLMQPDNSRISCCGEADAYWADSFKTQGDQYIAIITDDRNDVPSRPYLESGTEILIPNYKIKWDAGNPTGHGILFINAQKQVLCYVPPGGV